MEVVFVLIPLSIVLVLLAGVSPVPRDAWWQQSVFIGHLQDGAVWVRGFLPPDLAGAITYPDTPDEPSSPKTSST